MEHQFEDMSLWSEEDSGPPTPVLKQNSKEETLSTNNPERILEDLDKINRQIERMVNEAESQATSKAGNVGQVKELFSTIREADQASTRACNNLNAASNMVATEEWGKRLLAPEGSITDSPPPPRVIQVPEWLALLQLLAVQKPHLSQLAEELELVGHGYYPSAHEHNGLEEVGSWLTRFVGPVDIQIITSRLSHLKDKIGHRTRVVGEEAIVVCDELPIRYFRSRVVSVLKDDLETISLKIIASSGTVPPHAAIQIGRGINPYHIPSISGFWEKLVRIAIRTRLNKKPWQA